MNRKAQGWVADDDRVELDDFDDRAPPSYVCLFAGFTWEDWAPHAWGGASPHALTAKVVAGGMHVSTVHRNMAVHDVKLSFYPFGFDTTDL